MCNINFNVYVSYYGSMVNERTLNLMVLYFVSVIVVYLVLYKYFRRQFEFIINFIVILLLYIYGDVKSLLEILY